MRFNLIKPSESSWGLAQYTKRTGSLRRYADIGMRRYRRAVLSESRHLPRTEYAVNGVPLIRVNSEDWIMPLSAHA